MDTSGEALKEAVDEGVYLLKPNQSELCTLANKNSLAPTETKDAARELIGQGKCEVVVVSMGAAGAMLVTDELAEIITPPQVERKSTVGAGDSMVAGIVLYISNGHSLVEAVQYGVACGTAATLNEGTELCRKEVAEIIFNQLKIVHQ